MDDNNRMHLHWMGTCLSLFLAFVTWFGAHIAPISGGCAILAAYFSIRASRSTRKLRDDQLKNPHRYKWQEDTE